MHVRKFSSLFRNVFIILVFLVIIIIGYFSILGFQNSTIVNKIIKSFIEKNITQVQVDNLNTNLFLDWQDQSLTLGLKNFNITYAQKTSITFPQFKLKLSPINLMLWKPGQIIKGIIFDSQKIHVTYKKKSQTKDINAEKIPISDVINIANKYKKHLANAKYISNNFAFNIHTTGKEHTIIFKNLELQFDDFKNGLNADIKADININNLKLHSKFTVKDILRKALDIRGLISSINSLQDDQGFNIGDTNFRMGFQLDINTRVNFLNFFEQVDFQFLQMGAAYIHNSTYFSDGIQINNLAFKGRCLNNFKQVSIPEIKAKVENRILINGNMQHMSKNITSNFNVAHLSTKEFLKKWSSNSLPNVHHWLSEHLLAGIVTNFQITKDNMQKPSLNTNITFRDVDLKYLKTAPILHLKEAQLNFSSSYLNIKSDNARISNSKIKNITAKIDDLGQNEINMKFNASIEGSIPDHIKIANAHYTMPDLPNIDGTADTMLNFVVPFYKNPTFQDINLNLQSKLRSVSIQPLKEYSISNGIFEAKLLKHNLHVQGQGKINNYLNTRVNGIFSINDKRDFTIHLDTNTSLTHFQKAGIPFSKFFSNTMKVNGSIKGKKNTIESEFLANLYNTSVDLEAIGISKHPKIHGKIFIKFDYDWTNETKISKFTFTIPNQSLNGGGLINNKIDELVYFKGNISQYNAKDLILQYDKSANLEKLILDGKEVDISNLKIQKLFVLFNQKENVYKKAPFLFSSKIGKVKLKNDVSLTNVDIQINNVLDNKKVNMSGLLNKDEIFRVYYNYPVLSIISSNAGMLLKGLGIIEKANAGSLEFKGQFQTPQKFEGNLELNDFHILKTPALLDLLALSAPLSALKSSIENKGMKFNTLKCPIRYENNKVLFTDCIAKSKLFVFKISGDIDSNTSYLNSKGVIIPKNILNTLSKKIFLLKILSGHKNEGLILSTLFDMKGYIGQDMKVQANYLSTISPGFLREIFKKAN